MPCFAAVGRRHHVEERRVDAVVAGGEEAELPAALAAVGEERLRVLEVVALHHAAEDALGGQRRAVLGHHEGDLAGPHDDERHADDLVLPAPQAEVPARREHPRLVAGLARASHQPARRQRPAEAADHQPGLSFPDDPGAQAEDEPEAQPRQHDGACDEKRVGLNEVEHVKPILSRGAALSCIRPANPKTLDLLKPIRSIGAPTEFNFGANRVGMTAWPPCSGRGCPLRSR